jgi:hypothetical protein
MYGPVNAELSPLLIAFARMRIAMHKYYRTDEKENAVDFLQTAAVFYAGNHVCGWIHPSTKNSVYIRHCFLSACNLRKVLIELPKLA